MRWKPSSRGDPSRWRSTGGVLHQEVGEGLPEGGGPQGLRHHGIDQLQVRLRQRLLEYRGLVLQAAGPPLEGLGRCRVHGVEVGGRLPQAFAMGASFRAGRCCGFALQQGLRGWLQARAHPPAFGVHQLPQHGPVAWLLLWPRRRLPGGQVPGCRLGLAEQLPEGDSPWPRVSGRRGRARGGGVRSGVPRGRVREGSLDTEHGTGQVAWSGRGHYRQ